MDTCRFAKCRTNGQRHTELQRGCRSTSASSWPEIRQASLKTHHQFAGQIEQLVCAQQADVSVKLVRTAVNLKGAWRAAAW